MIPILSRRAFLATLATAVVAATGVAAVAATNVRDAAELPAQTLRGVTIDSLDNIEAAASVLSSSAKRLTVRLVMDPERSVDAYEKAVEALTPHADIMIQVLDSTELSHYSVEWIADRTRAAMAAFGDDVDIWEIGNELNGSWAGISPTQINKKARAAYDVVRAGGGKTAITFNYWSSSDCYSQPWEATLSYARRSALTFADVDYVFLSVYETVCVPSQHPSAADLASMLNDLGEMYPSSYLGIGEVGAQGVADGLSSDPSMVEKERLARYYYGLHDALVTQVGPRYVGGYFWWYFREDVIDAPEESSLWPTLNELLNNLE